MWEHDCSCAPVCADGDEQKLVGMITDRDIAMSALFQGRPLREITVEVAMSHSVCACHPEDAPDQVERKMIEWQILHIPVVSDQGQLVGIVLLGNLVREIRSRDMHVAAFVTDSEFRNILAAICERPDHRATPVSPVAAIV
jgi:CBS-domain-containing membrane protein